MEGPRRRGTRRRRETGSEDTALMTRSAVRHAPRQGIGNHCGPESSITARPGPPEGPGPGPPTPEAQTPGHQDSEGRRRRGGDAHEGQVRARHLCCRGIRTSGVGVGAGRHPSCSTSRNAPRPCEL
ncbi:unnamed protein product [Prorocentrum cordatum]|uniref:Uncharacterized protein n=1 Tax=Prorocentrum cordatum TaxID=2364126 RepID=A0ABN9T6V4_9DINO|nr:unnamed protein product [Polarella glacialis]